MDGGPGFPGIVRAYGDAPAKPAVESELRRLTVRLPKRLPAGGSTRRPERLEQLEALFRESPEWRFAEIEQVLGLSRTLVNRMLNGLIERGPVEAHRRRAQHVLQKALIPKAGGGSAPRAGPPGRASPGPRTQKRPTSRKKSASSVSFWQG